MIKEQFFFNDLLFYDLFCPCLNVFKGLYVEKKFPQ